MLFADRHGSDAFTLGVDLYMSQMSLSGGGAVLHTHSVRVGFVGPVPCAITILLGTVQFCAILGCGIKHAFSRLSLS